MGRWILRVALVLQCIGAARYVLGKGTPLASILFIDAGVPEALTLGMDQGIAIALLVGAGLLLARPSRPLLYALAGWFAADAVLAAYWGGNFGAELAPVARAIRFTAPLALLAVEHRPERAERLLTWGIALVFIGHGVECLLANPHFLDFLIVILGVTQPTATTMLFAIGAVDVLLAVLLVTRPDARWVLLYMCAWGFLTAGIRTVYFGPEGYHRTLLRALNGAAPLALLVWAWSAASVRRTQWVQH